MGDVDEGTKILPPAVKRRPPNAGKGRPRGVPNKKTDAARKVALAFLERRTNEEIDALWEASKAESPGKALTMYFGAVEFVLPKLARTEVVGDGGGPVRVIKVDMDE